MSKRVKRSFVVETPKDYNKLLDSLRIDRNIILTIEDLNGNTKDGAFLLTVLYAWGFCGYDKNQKAALIYLQKAANMGHKMAWELLSRRAFYKHEYELCLECGEKSGFIHNNIRGRCFYNLGDYDKAAKYCALGGFSHMVLKVCIQYPNVWQQRYYKHLKSKKKQEIMTFMLLSKRTPLTRDVKQLIVDKIVSH